MHAAWLQGLNAGIQRLQTATLLLTPPRQPYPSRYQGMPTNDTDNASQGTLDSTLYMSAIDIGLASGSGKTIDSIKLYHNDKLLREVGKTIRAGESHPEEFSQPLLALDPSDKIRVSAHCSTSWRKLDVTIELNLPDIKCVRDERNRRLYRTKARNIEVVVTAHQQSSLPTFMTETIQACPRFRLLVMGNSGVGKSTLIHRVFGVEGVKPSKNSRGEAEIEREFTSLTNERFVVHDSLGFEAGDERYMEIVKEFVARRKEMPLIKDQLHAIWLCLDTPYAGGRLLETGVEDLLRRRKEILGDIPLVVVLTKVDLLDGQLEAELPKNTTLESHRSKYMEEHFIKPLRDAAGPDVTHIAVSKEEDYNKSLLDLLEATNDNMAKYYVDGSPSIVASIAQRISIKKKIELSIGIGKKRYWPMLFKSAVLRGDTCTEYLQAIYKDTITIWNFNDPNQYLMNNTVIEAFLRTENIGDTDASISSTAASFPLLEWTLRMGKFLESDDAIALRYIAGLAVSVPGMAYQGYKEAKKDSKAFIAYVVDLLCVMQIIFILISGDQVTLQKIAVALQAYENPRKTVRRSVTEVDAKMGLVPGGRDHALDKIEELVWRYGTADHDILKQRDRAREAVPQCSVSS